MIATIEEAAATDSKVALVILKSLGLLEPAAIGPTDPKKLEANEKSSRMMEELLSGIGGF